MFVCALDVLQQTNPCMSRAHPCTLPSTTNTTGAAFHLLAWQVEGAQHMALALTSGRPIHVRLHPHSRCCAGEML